MKPNTKTKITIPNLTREEFHNNTNDNMSSSSVPLSLNLLGKGSAITNNVTTSLEIIQSLNSTMQSRLLKTDLFVNGSTNLPMDIMNVEQLGNLDFVLVKPLSTAPVFVSREVKMYCDFYTKVTTEYFSNMSEIIDKFSPAAIQLRFGGLAAKNAADDLFFMLQGGTSRNARNLISLGEYANEGILFDIFQEINAGPITDKSLMQMILLLLMYELNIHKSKQVHDELWAVNADSCLATLHTSFDKKLLDIIHKRWHLHQSPELIKSLISEINTRVINDSSMRQVKVMQMRQSDIAMEFPLIIERYMMYMYINFFITYQDTLYSAITAQVLRAQTLLTSTTDMLKVNNLYEPDQWVHTNNVFAELASEYEKTSMSGGVITQDIIKMYESMRRTEVIFELASLMTHARTQTGDTNTRYPAKPETFSLLANHVQPMLLTDMTRLINMLTIIEQWMLVEIDHINTMTNVSLKELGIEMVSSSDLATKIIPPSIALSERRTSYNQETLNTYIINLPDVDAFVRVNPEINSQLQSMSFLTRKQSESDLMIDGVQARLDLLREDPIPNDYHLELSEIIKPLLLDMYMVLLDHGVVSRDATGEIPRILSEILEEQAGDSILTIAMHKELMQQSRGSIFDDYKQRANYKTENKLTDDDLVPLDESDTAENKSSGEWIEKVRKALADLSDKFKMLGYISTPTVFHMPLRYDADTLFSQKMVSLLIKSYQHIYVCKSTGELFYPVVAYKNDFDKIDTTLGIVVFSNGNEIHMLVPACNISKIPPKCIYLPELGVGISFAPHIPSMIDQSGAITMHRRGNLIKTDAQVRTRFKNDVIQELIHSGHLDARPAGMESHKYYYLDFNDDHLHYQKKSLRNLLYLVIQDESYKQAPAQRTMLCTKLLVHIATMFQKIPLSWFTGASRSHFALYKQYAYLTELYQSRQEWRESQLAAFPDEKSMARRLLYVFLAKLYSYGIVVSNVKNLKEELALLNLPLSFPVIDLYKGSSDTTLRDVVTMLLNNEELTRMILADEKDVEGLLLW